MIRSLRSLGWNEACHWCLIKKFRMLLVASVLEGDEKGQIHMQAETEVEGRKYKIHMNAVRSYCVQEPHIFEVDAQGFSMFSHASVLA